MVNEGSHVKPQVKGHPRFRPCWHTHPPQGIVVMFIPSMLAPAVSEYAFTPIGRRPELVSGFVGIVTILTRKGGRRRRARFARASGGLSAHAYGSHLAPPCEARSNVRTALRIDSGMVGHAVTISASS